MRTVPLHEAHRPSPISPFSVIPRTSERNSSIAMSDCGKHARYASYAAHNRSPNSRVSRLRRAMLEAVRIGRIRYAWQNAAIVAPSLRARSECVNRSNERGEGPR